MHLGKILIRLGECTGWSVSLLSAHVRLYIFSCCSLITYKYLAHAYSCCLTWKILRYHLTLTDILLASVAQLDARPTGDQEVAGSTPAGLAYSFMEIWSWNIFYSHSLPSADSRGQLSFSGKRMCTILVNHFKDWAFPVKVRLDKLTTLNMTPLGWLGRKLQHKQNDQYFVV